MAGSPLSAPNHVRARWYLQVDKYGKSVKDVCNIFGISRKTYYKWYNKDHGLINNVNYTNKKIHPDTKLTPKIKQFIYNNKILYNYGPQKMKILVKKELDISISTTAIYKYYKNKRLIRKPQKKLQWYTPLKKQYNAEYPGENVQLDVKYVPGEDEMWEYQFRFIDTVTNIQYFINMQNLESKTTIKAFKKAQKYFPCTITGIQTDNGSEFRGNFHKYLVKNKIIHRYIPKKSAPWNGKVERANRSVDDEYYLNTTKPWKSLNAYNKWYNYDRIHVGKGMNGMTPYEKYLSLV
jgi:transposase